MTICGICAALVVGGCLATSGATFQSVLRNPLAEPYVLGLVGGASLGVSLVYWMGLAAVSAFAVPCAAFAGACLSLALVCGVAALAARGERRSALSGGVVILAGFVTGGFTNALQMLVLAYATPEQSAAAMKWVWGDINGVSAGPVAWAALAFTVAFLVLYSQNRKLNAFVLGEDAAQSLGVKVRRVQLIAFAAASLATAAAVALVGAIGFLGLIVPHVVRRLVGADHRVYLPVSAVVGAVFLLVADCLARLLPGTLPTGVICALTGTPFFLWLLCARRGRVADGTF